MEYSIENWVEEAKTDRVSFRQAVRIVLTAISNSEYLQPKMIMKGGMLLGIRYKSTRFTEDIDFSTAEKFSDINPEEFKEELNEALLIASSNLPYQIECRIQSLKIQPKAAADAKFPSFYLKIGYADKNNTRQMKRLLDKSSTNTIKIDYSFNELTNKLDKIELDNDSVLAYSYIDLIAEKIRSIIQQPYRNRNRRQDIYDLQYLFNNTGEITSEEKLQILSALLKKSEERLEAGVVNRETLNRQDIYEYSEKNYHLLKDEIEDDLMPFSEAYSLINEFYKSLPWDCFCEVD